MLRVDEVLDNSAFSFWLIFSFSFNFWFDCCLFAGLDFEAGSHYIM